MNDQSTSGLGHGFNIPDPAELVSLKGTVSDTEWALRVELAATYRLCALHGWTDLVFTHISARLPDEDGEERFLINPYGIMFDEMTASCLVKIDLHGNICQETPYFINPAGFTIHSAIHAAREDAGCVIHVHTPYGVAVSVQNEGLRRYTQFSMIVNNDLAYHDYEGIALDLDERQRLEADLGQKFVMILRNHGLLVCGRSVGEAFELLHGLEHACDAQIAAQAGGGELILPAADVCAHTADQFWGAPSPEARFGGRAWPAMRRMIDRHNPGYAV